jgi:DegV family protein with EDD domain
MKDKIALLTDSTCDLPKKVLDRLSINFLPLKIIFKDGEYRDRVDIKPGEVYKRFEEEIPTTSMPGPDDIKEKLLELKDQDFTHIIIIHISSGLSSTYDVSRMVSKEMEGLTVDVIDSKMLSKGLGRLVLYTQELIEQQKLDFSEIINKVKEKRDEIDLFFVVKTLKYLKEGGRIGKVKGTIGQLLNIKPIISIDGEGQYYTYDRARSRKKSIKKLYKIANEKINKGLFYIDVMHADAEKEAKSLLNKFKKLENVKDVVLGEISPAMTVHAGPGLIGLCITPV